MKKNSAITKFEINLRKEYRSLDIFDQVRRHKEFKDYCIQQGCNMFLLTCTDEHFQDLLKEQRLDQTCNVYAS